MRVASGANNIETFCPSNSNPASTMLKQNSAEGDACEPNSKGEGESHLEREESLGDAASLQKLSRLSMTSRDRPWRAEQKDTWRLSMPRDSSLTSSISQSSESESDCTPEKSDSRAASSRREKSVSSSVGQSEGKIIVVGIQLKLEGWPGTNLMRVELDSHSKELFDYALEKLARRGDSVIGIYVHKPARKLPVGKTEQDLPHMMDNVLAAWEALAEPKKVKVEGRVKVADKAKPAFTQEARALGAHTVLLSCSMAKLIKKQMFGTHKWGDRCIQDMPRTCTVIVVRHGSVTTSARGEAGEKKTLSALSMAFRSSRSRELSYGELEKATNLFGATQLARQGAAIGNVYLGSFSGGNVGVVKRYKGSGRLNDKALAEIREQLLRWRDRAHSNLVGFCNFLLDKRFCLIVTDYLPQGCVFDNLHGMNHQRRLSWAQRSKIAAGVADGLNFLHSSCSPPAVHGSLHSANLLLDLDMEPVITDYWLGHLRAPDGCPPYFELPPGCYGTLGYLAPELERRAGQLPSASLEGDIYAFGVLLLELVTGKQAFDESRKPAYLFAWVKKLALNREYRELVDPRLFSSYSLPQVASLVELAVACCDLNPQRRPPMDEVVRRVEQAVYPDSSSDAEPQLR